MPSYSENQSSRTVWGSKIEEFDYHHFGDGWNRSYSNHHESRNLTISAIEVILDSGEYTVELVFDLQWQLFPDRLCSVAFHMTVEYTQPYVTVTSSDTAQLVRIAANGMAIHLGNQLSAIFGTDIDDGKPGIVLQGMKANDQPVGLRIDGTNGIRVNRGDDKGWTAL